MQKDTREENVVVVESQLSTEVHVDVQRATKVQAMVEAQKRAMEMQRRESKVIAKRISAILDKATLLGKGTKILDPKRFMWT